MNQVAVLYENDEIFVIDKPAGLASQGGQGVSHSLDQDFARQVAQKIYLVHRLDKDTRGLMIVAKSSGASAKWTRLIADKSVVREYLALCAGRMDTKNGVIKDSLVQHDRQKSAVTHFKVEDEWTVTVDGISIPLSLLRLRLETGRMHQIRIHLAKNGCPVAGDDRHGDFRVNKILRRAGVRRAQLASVRLELPLDGGRRIFTLDDVFAGILERTGQ